MIQQNLIVNPSFETNVSFTSWSNGAPTFDNTTGLFGTASLSFITSINDDHWWYTASDSGITQLVNSSYIFSIHVKGSGTIRLWVYDGAVDQFSTNIVLTSTWTRYNLTVTCQATGMLLGIRLPSANSVTLNCDGGMLQIGSTLRDYFDGAQANCSWSGTANASYSIENSTAISSYRYGAVGNGMSRSEGWT